MKKSLLKFLPFVAAVLLATSCSEDETINENNIADAQNNTVEIPISLKIANANSLSKVAFTNDGSTINFEETDLATVKLTVTGDGVSGSLDLVNDGGYKFSGMLSVEKEKESEFVTDGVDLQGTFTQTKGSETSNTDFNELLNNCAHTYNTTFKSTDNSLELIDQNFYVYVAAYKESITIGGNAVTSANFTKGNYYAFQISTSVTGLPEGVVVEPCKLYTIGKAVSSVAISGQNSAVWGDDAFELTATVNPNNATNQIITWSCTTGNAELTPSGDNNTTCSVLVTGTGTVTITATVDDQIATHTITVPTEYVNLGDAGVWKTSDESGKYYPNYLPSVSGYKVPSKAEFDLLWTKCDVSGSTFTTRKNDSGAQIALTAGTTWQGAYVTSDKQFVIAYSDGRHYWFDYFGADSQYAVRLLRQ